MIRLHGIEARLGYRRQAPHEHPPACWNCLHLVMKGPLYCCGLDNRDEPLLTYPGAVCDAHPRVQQASATA